MFDVPPAMDPTRNQPPVALRIVRPYPTEDELLAAESNAFTRTGVVLLGAPSKPGGVVLRFEMCLNDGTPVMRGEGRVVGFRPADENGESALMLRFTKLDVKSKDLLDRAVALREERRSLAPPPPPPAPHPPTSVPPAPSGPPPKAPSLPPPAPVPAMSPPPPQVAASAPPPTDRDAVAEVAPVEPTPAPSLDVEPAMDVDDLDLQSADESDLTEQAPPVALLGAAGIGKDKFPPPQRAPVIPAPPFTPPVEPAPERHAPEHPVQHTPEEHMPAPQRSPEPKVRADVLARALERKDGAFQPSLDPTQRESALDRLRKRKSS